MSDVIPRGADGRFSPGYTPPVRRRKGSRNKKTLTTLEMIAATMERKGEAHCCERLANGDAAVKIPGAIRYRPPAQA
jgi:hypothetical protein